MLTKQEIRKSIRAEKKNHSQQELSMWSEEICCILENSERFIQAKTVLLYYALPDEVDTIHLIRKYAGRKQILLPVIQGASLSIRRYESGQLLSDNNAFGILEPTGPDIKLKETDIDLAIIPGMAFCRDGRRLGRGKGYYDRLLSDLPDTVYKMGLCFPFQMLEEIPTETHDILMNQIITATQ